MAMLRFLGAAWASVHGPSDVRRLVSWTLEAGFRGLLPGPAPRPVDWPAVGRAAADLPIEFPAVRVGTVLTEKSATAGLASSLDGEQRKARDAVRQAVATASTLGVQVIILEPGLVPLMGEIGAEDLGEPGMVWTPEKAQAMAARRKAGLNAALDRVCRTLFELCKLHVETRFCLTPGRSLRAVGGIDGLQAIFEDLGHCQLGYWHDTAVTARREQVLGEAQGLWLENFSNRCIGCTLGDATADGMYLPPGAGGVDYPLLANYLRRAGKALPASLELDPSVDRAELPGMHACLDKFGL